MPPLSRQDLPGIIESIRVLYRVIEHPPAAPWRPPAWLVEQYRKTTAGEEALREYKESWVVRGGHHWLIGEAAQAVLDRLTPPNHHAGEDCPEINDSGLDLSHKVTLLGLRRRLMRFALGHELAGNRSARLEMLHCLESALGALGETAGPFGLDSFLADGLLADAHAAESNRRALLAWGQRDAAQRALSRLVDHTTEGKLRDALDDPNAAPSYLDEWATRIMDYARALAALPDADAAARRACDCVRNLAHIRRKSLSGGQSAQDSGHYPWPATDGGWGRFAANILQLAFTGDGDRKAAVRRMLGIVWRSRVNTFFVNQALHRICEAPLLSAAPARLEGGGEAADASDRRGRSEEGKPKRKRRGRRPDPEIDPKRDKRLCADWATAKGTGMSREAFARERGITVQDLIAAQDRQKYRRTRDAE
jgi:hypothetical protein